MQLFGQAEVDFGKVDEHGDTGTARADRLFELAKLAVDARQMADDLGEAHDGHLFGADDAIEARCGHALAAHAEELRRLASGGKLLFERGNYERAVVLAAGLACRDENAGRHFF